MLFSTEKRIVVCHCLGQELQGNFCSPRQSVSIKPLSPRSEGDGHRSRHPLHLLVLRGCQVFWRPLPHPVNQMVNGSWYPQGYFHIGNPASADVNCLLGCQQQPMVLGVVWAALEPLGWIHLQPLAAGGGWEVLSDTGFGYYLFKKTFLHHSVLH